MIKHIVMWRLQEFALGATKQENESKMKARLEELRTIIPSIVVLEVGINSNKNPAAYDVVLYSEFHDWDGLEEYQKHAAHVAVKRFVAAVVVDGSRRVVDYEV